MAASPPGDVHLNPGVMAVSTLGNYLPTFQMSNYLERVALTLCTYPPPPEMFALGFWHHLLILFLTVYLISCCLASLLGLLAIGNILVFLSGCFPTPRYRGPEGGDGVCLGHFWVPRA